jgi:hypothetical protein
LSRDNALEQKWPGSGSQECKSLNMHNFHKTCQNGASEVSTSEGCDTWYQSRVPMFELAH